MSDSFAADPNASRFKWIQCN